MAGSARRVALTATLVVGTACGSVAVAIPASAGLDAAGHLGAANSTGGQSGGTR